MSAVPRREETHHRERLTALLIGLAGAVVAVAASWRPSLWTDEAATISAARRSLPELYAMAGNLDAVHATYYALMHAWLLVVPADAFWLRLPSAIAVGVAAAGVFAIGRRLGGSALGLASGTAYALLPRTTWMGLEARSYAFSSLLAVLATAVLLRWLDIGADRADEKSAPRRTGWAVAYAALVGLGIAVNLYVALVLVAHGIAILATRLAWRRRFAWLAAGIVGVLLAGGVVWVSVHQSGQLGDGGLTVSKLARSIVVNQWFLGETPSLTTGTGQAGGNAWKYAAVLLALAGWLLIVGALVLHRSPMRLRLLVWAAPWAVVPTVVIVAYALTVRDIYNPRYLSFATGGLALLLGHGVLGCARWLAERRPFVGRVRVLLVVFALLGAALASPIYLSQRGPYAKASSDWSHAAAFVEANRSPQSGVYFSPRFPITGPTVGQTARGVSVAYPGAFAGLTDVTLLRTPVEDHNLTGTSRLLQDSTAQLDGLQHVWVIRRNDYAYAQQDDQTLLEGSYVAGRRWQGPLDQVIEYDRLVR